MAKGSIPFRHIEGLRAGRREFYFEGLGEYYTRADGRGLWCIDQDPDGRESHGRIYGPDEFSVAGLTKLEAARKIRARLSEEG